mmetsp:Transcript_6124/g.11982  ORF Transcript_6124/g.11982 Transcript_6124/m.11982 type:complete len:128 (+) Transcript_6124:184-567(+)
MLFCPVCSNLLLANFGRGEEGKGGGRGGAAASTGALSFSCLTCPYMFRVTRRIEEAIPIPSSLRANKLTEQVLGGDAGWELADRAEVTCIKCGHGTAFFFQMQTRSADEPMTTFYRCEGCTFQWKEN